MLAIGAVAFAVASQRGAPATSPVGRTHHPRRQGAPTSAPRAAGTLEVVLAGPTSGKSTLQAQYGPALVFDVEQSIDWRGLQKTFHDDLYLGDAVNWEHSLDFMFVHHHCVLPALLACRALAGSGGGGARVCVVNLATPQSVAVMERLLDGLNRMRRVTVSVYNIPSRDIEERILSRPVRVLGPEHGSYGWTVSCHILLAGIASRIGAPVVTDIEAEVLRPLEKAERAARSDNGGHADANADAFVPEGVYYCQWHEPTDRGAGMTFSSEGAMTKHTLIEISPHVFVETQGGPHGTDEVAYHYTQQVPIAGAGGGGGIGGPRTTVLLCNTTTKGCRLNHRRGIVTKHRCGWALRLTEEGVAKIPPGGADGEGRVFAYPYVAVPPITVAGHRLPLPPPAPHHYLPRRIVESLARFEYHRRQPHASETRQPCIVAYWGSFAPYHNGHQDTLLKAIEYLRSDGSGYAYLGALVVPLPQRCFRGTKPHELPTLYEFHHRALVAHLQVDTMPPEDNVFVDAYPEKDFLANIQARLSRVQDAMLPHLPNSGEQAAEPVTLMWLNGTDIQFSDPQKTYLRNDRYGANAKLLLVPREGLADNWKPADLCREGLAEHVVRVPMANTLQLSSTKIRRLLEESQFSEVNDCLASPAATAYVMYRLNEYHKSLLRNPQGSAASSSEANASEEATPPPVVVGGRRNQSLRH